MSGPTIYRQKNGFTLIEVLIALMLLALIGMGILNFSSVYLSGASHMRDKVIAGWIADNVLTEMRVSDDYPSTGIHPSTINMANMQWPVEVEINNSKYENIDRVEVRVLQPKGGAARAGFS